MDFYDLLLINNYPYVVIIGCNVYFIFLHAESLDIWLIAGIGRLKAMFFVCFKPIN